LLTAEVGRFSDFVLYSPRKFLGVPDGGILVLNCDIDLALNLAPPPAEWWLKALSATVMRREFDVHGGTRRWFDLYREVEAGAPTGHYAMSELTALLLRHSFDYSAIAERRARNYEVLLGELGDIAVFPERPSTVVPLGFPVRLRDRDDVRRVLFEHRIFPPVHWPIRGVVPAKFQDSHRLSSEILTLPCDQRYDADDMHRMARLVSEEICR
jgi:dTDP-4-amino-4,6-dideoxygalactose transaminase